MKNGEIGYCVTGKDFSALVVAADTIVIKAAPSFRWAVGRTVGRFRQQCDSNKWRVAPVLEEDAHEYVYPMRGFAPCHP